MLFVVTFNLTLAYYHCYSLFRVLEIHKSQSLSVLVKSQKSCSQISSKLLVNFWFLWFTWDCKNWRFGFLPAQLWENAFIPFLVNLAWAPQTHKVTCRASLCPAHPVTTSTPPLWWCFVTNPVGPTPPKQLFPTPLLPGYHIWPLVWPRIQWTPPRISSQVCPNSDPVPF